MFSILTLNTFLLDVRLMGLFPLFRRAPHIKPRLAALGPALGENAPDVICLQEVFRRPHRHFLQQALKHDYPYVAGLESPGRPLGTGLMVFSRHKIETSQIHEFSAAHFEERLVTRHGALCVSLEVPGLGRGEVITTHLTSGGLFRHPEAAGAEAVRKAQIGELLALAQKRRAESKSDWCLIAGDLNAGPESSLENYALMLESGYLDAFAGGHEAGAPALTWDPANPIIWSGKNRRLPRQRIDHVFLHKGETGGGRPAPLSAQVVFRERRVAIGKGERTPLSDHYGVMAHLGKE